MLDVSDLKVGNKVCYCPKGASNGYYKNGIVKNIPGLNSADVIVVSLCDGLEELCISYTASVTEISDLELGWRKNV